MKRLPAQFGVAAWIALTLVVLPTAIAAAGQEPAAEAAPAPADAKPTESTEPAPAAKTRPLGPLPWEEPPRVSEPVLRPPAGPAEILERFDVGASQLAGFFSGQPLGPSEEDVLVKILYLYPKFGLDNIERWRKTGIDWDKLAAAPEAHRAEIFPMRGRVLRVQKQTLAPELVEFYEFDHYFCVTLAIDDSAYHALICTRHIPAAWKIDAPLDERAAADGLFLKVGDAAAEQPQFVFLAGRVAWLPDRVSPEQQIDKPQVALANLGFDVGLFDDVRATKTLPPGDNDREAFYQLLHALGRAEAEQLRGTGAEPLDPVPLLKAPEKHNGQILRLRGRVQRVMKVPVEDADIRRRFGIDHYYEIDVRLPLGDTSVRLGKAPAAAKKPGEAKKKDSQSGTDAEDEKEAVYANTFPATLLVRRLPPGLPEGENVHEVVRADAVFYKVWTYRSQYTDPLKQLQPALMFMATEPAVVPFEAQTNTVVSALVSTALLVALGTVLIVWWWFGRSDRAAREAARAAQPQTPPDFSKLAE
jgi:hypothetical protein